MGMQVCVSVQVAESKQLHERVAAPSYSARLEERFDVSAWPHQCDQIWVLSPSSRNSLSAQHRSRGPLCSAWVGE